MLSGFIRVAAVSQFPSLIRLTHVILEKWIILRHMFKQASKEGRGSFPRLSSRPSLSETPRVAGTPPARDGAVHLVTHGPAIKATGDF